MEDVMYFCVISYKRTLGDYRDFINMDPVRYYHKCAAYALEIIGNISKNRGINKSSLHILFEKNNSFNRDMFKSYIRKIKVNPTHGNHKYLDMISADNIMDVDKKKMPVGLLPDFVVSSIYSCFNTDEYGNIEYRYLLESYMKYFSDSNGFILGYGIKPIHKIEQINADKNIKNILKCLNVNYDVWSNFNN